MHREHSQYVPHAYASPRAHARTRARRKVDDQVGTPRAPRQPRCCARRSRGSRPPAAGVQCRGAGRAACRWPPWSPWSPWPPWRPPSPSRRPSAPESAGSPVAPGAGAAGCWYLGALPRAQVDPRLRPAAQRRDCAQSGSPPPWAAPPPTCSAPTRADGRSEGLPNFFGRCPAKLSASAWSALTRRSRCHFHLSVCASRPRSPSNRSGTAASAVHPGDTCSHCLRWETKCFSPGCEHFPCGCEGVIRAVAARAREKRRRAPWLRGATSIAST
jgi:hypothetical protein